MSGYVGFNHLSDVIGYVRKSQAAKGHYYLFYQAPLDHTPRRISIRAKKVKRGATLPLSTAKKFYIESWSNGLSYQVDAGHLDRFRRPR